MSVKSAQTAQNLPADRSSAVLEENRRLRRAMRDLVALSTLPAIWSGQSREAIARSLGDVLLNTLSLDLVYVRLGDVAQPGFVEVVRGRQSRGGGDEKEAQALLMDALDAGHGEVPPTIRDPFGAGMLRTAMTRFGIGVDHGVLIAGSRSEGFPTDQDRLMLSVGANQTAIVIQRRQAEDRVDEQRQWLQVTLASIGDGVITTDIDGRVTFVNAVAEALTGWSAADARGRPLESVFSVIDEDSRIPVANPVDAIRRGGAVISMASRTVLIAKDGTETPVDDSASPIKDAAGTMIGIVMVFRNAAMSRRAEQLRNARLEVTHGLSQSDSVQQGAERVLRAVCDNLKWDAGCFWLADTTIDRLRCHAHWARPDRSAGAFVSQACGWTFERGVGLPGRVWGSGKPDWVPDLAADGNFPRLSQAEDGGLRSAFACPIVIGGKTLGVLEFFSQRTRVPDPDVLEMMGATAGNVGQFIERKVAEEDLRRSEEELAEFFENATVGLHWVGPDGTVLRVNRAELEMLGYSREEYLGHHIAEFHADKDLIRDILARLNAGERLAEQPARLRCKDGTIKHVLIDSSVRWKDDQFVHTRCFTRDITARWHAEAALADARARLDAALEAGAIATWTWDIANNRLYADRKLAQIFNLPHSEADGAPLNRYLQSIHPDDVTRITTALEHAIAHNELYEEDYRVVQTDGSVRWVSARGHSENDASGRPVRMPGVLVDITERKLLEEALREADRRKDEFLATLAHELRNPLAPVRNGLEIMKMPRMDAGTFAQTRAMMERQVHQLVRLVDDLLDVSRVMGGKIELRKEYVELANVITRAVETVQPLIAAQGHRLALSIPQDSLLLEADPVRMAQVVGNLLTNAAKYTESNGRIWVEAERAGAEVVLRVRDNGIGIAPEMLARVFDLFVQADHASNKAQGGLGIGLTLAKNLVQMHGGTIAASSGGIGEGAVFTVRLPLANSQAVVPDSVLESTPAYETTSSGHRILVVDDNEDAAMSLTMFLGLQGHTVEMAHDGMSAIAKARSFLPHAIFLDIGMPGMDGYEVARQLRRQPGLERVVITALTGWGQREDRQRTAEAGFDHHLVKPAEAKVLEALLEKSLSGFRAPS
ncbi:hypothetical protein ASC95_17960 [Pelomonas sp. Root1217]|uniref:PAS domain S-box protein n=1 Tax=Pelomonas sp. Root1217 TaxID=1736430 RepID=UPI00070B78B4|nr:PAS domain S-box protein [Pelomonas sp. Root1217]KQV49480.1 hypothetical protein ASC95_17960 [Pelomonas sp. Root1217]